MGFSCGLVGLPNAGKTTLFNALTGARAAAAAYPFCTVEPNHGMVAVADERLQAVARVVAPEKVTPTTLEFVDIAGLVKGAAQGEGLGNQFLGHIQAVDAIAQVVRCFSDDNVSHPHQRLDPVGDLEVVQTELLLRDHEVVTRRLDRQRKVARGGERAAAEEVAVLEQVEQALARGQAVRRLQLGEAAAERLRPLSLLTAKPVFYVASISDDQLAAGDEHPLLGPLRSWCRQAGGELVEISARTESELNELEPAERIEFMKELGIVTGGVQQVVETGYRVLGLLTFFTTAGVEVRAWTVPRGTRAEQAAGKIHKDMQRGFIRAEVIPWRQLVEQGGEQAARERGLIRLEGRDYLVQDGDVIRFRFKV